MLEYKSVLGMGTVVVGTFGDDDGCDSLTAELDDGILVGGRCLLRY